jgi:hypothetical protein
MKLLAATSQCFGIIDDHGVRPIHQGAGVYAGITWNEENIFVAALRNEGLWNAQTKAFDETKESVLVFDRHLRLIEDLRVGTIDTHMIHWCSKRGALLVCDAGNDRIVEIERPQGGARMFWRPAVVAPEPEPGMAGRHHLNSVWTDADGRAWIILRYGHPRPGLLVRLDLGGRVSRTVEIPREAHSAYHHHALSLCASYDEALWFHNTRGGTSTQVALRAGYPRGIAEVDGVHYVGGSARGPRHVRHKGGAQLLTVEDGRVGRRGIGPVGQIYCVRAAGAIDMAHHGTWGPPCPATPDVLESFGRPERAS